MLAVFPPDLVPIFCGVVPIREMLNKMLEHHAHQ